MKNMRGWLAIASLFGSLATVSCCVVPALFVALGAGASFAALLGTVPQLVLVSEHKGLVFGIGAVALVAAWIAERRAANRACPMDPKMAEGCSTAKRWSQKLLVTASVFYVVGFVFAFVLPLFG